MIHVVGEAVEDFSIFSPVGWEATRGLWTGTDEIYFHSIRTLTAVGRLTCMRVHAEVGGTVQGYHSDLHWVRGDCGLS
jgi:hypothetical protein